MTDQPLASSATVDDTEIPIGILEEAVHAVIKTCDVQVELKIEVMDQPFDPREAKLELGSNIALTSEHGRWNLSVMADERSCQVFTRYFFAMEEDEGIAMEDVADAMGEIVNVAAGVFKAKRVEAGEDIYLGLPLFMLGNSCVEYLARGVRGISQSVTGPEGLTAHVILMWESGS